jgi:hypothetical protein
MADKTVSIKSATDRQLDELIVRLRKENDAQNLIFELKRKSTKRDPLNPNAYNYSYEFPEVSTEMPVEDLYHDSVEDTLAHFGILGQKWGIRRFQNPDGSLTPAGEKRYARKTARQTYIQKEKQARKEYEKVVKYRINTGKEWFDVSRGMIGTLGLITGAGIISKTLTGENIATKILNKIADPFDN